MRFSKINIKKTSFHKLFLKILFQLINQHLRLALSIYLKEYSFKKLYNPLKSFKIYIKKLCASKKLRLKVKLGFKTKLKIEAKAEKMTLELFKIKILYYSQICQICYYLSRQNNLLYYFK